MPRPSEWTNNNREKLREYSRQYRKDNPEYFRKYEAKYWLKLKIQRKIWLKKYRKNKDYYTREQRRDYLRAWRVKNKENKQWGINYLNNLNANN